MAGKQVVAREITKFNHIYVIQDGNLRELWFKGDSDYFLQSRIDISNSSPMNMIYSRMMIACLLIKPNPERVLIIGLGGAIMPNYLKCLYPKIEIDIVEVDPKVIDLSKEFFFFKESERCRVHEQDGRVFVQEKLGKTTYDIVLLDAFKSGSVPYHLKTLQFYREISGLLAPGGVVGSNLYGKSNSLKPHDVKTFAKVFKHNYIFQDPDQIATVLFATNQEKKSPPEDLTAAAEKLTASNPLSIPMKDIAAMYMPDALTEELGFVFRDDFPEHQFLKSVEKNNLDNSEPRPYSIMNTIDAKG